MNIASKVIPDDVVNAVLHSPNAPMPVIIQLSASMIITNTKNEEGLITCPCASQLRF